jgi:hypothetical protein
MLPISDSAAILKGACEFVLGVSSTIDSEGTRRAMANKLKDVFGGKTAA